MPTDGYCLVQFSQTLLLFLLQTAWEVRMRRSSWRGCSQTMRGMLASLPNYPKDHYKILVFAGFTFQTLLIPGKTGLCWTSLPLLCSHLESPFNRSSMWWVAPENILIDTFSGRKKSAPDHLSLAQLGKEVLLIVSVFAIKCTDQFCHDFAHFFTEL